MPTFGLGAAAGLWKIKNPERLMAWAFGPSTSMQDGLAVLEFVRDGVLADPDFGEIIAENTRGDTPPGTDAKSSGRSTPSGTTSRSSRPSPTMYEAGVCLTAHASAHETST